MSLITPENLVSKKSLKKVLELLNSYDKSKYQVKIIPGTGLNLDAQGNLTLGFDLELFKIVPPTESLESAPADKDKNKIHLVKGPDTGDGSNNKYDELIWTGTEWEKLGSVTVDMNITGLNTRVQTLEGKVKTMEDTTIPGINNKVNDLTTRVEALEDYLDETEAEALFKEVYGD